MSVAQGHEALDDDALASPGTAWTPPEPSATEPPETSSAAPPSAATGGARPGHLARSHLPPLPPVPSGPVAWLQAARVRSLPGTLLGVAVGGLLVARHPASRPGLLALAVVALVLAHALTGLLGDLGDARPGRAGPLRRVEAGRAALGVTTAGLCALFLLVSARGLTGLALAGGGALAVLLAVSRRSGAGLTGLAGLCAGAVAVAVPVWAATGALDVAAGLAAAAVGGLLAAMLLGRRPGVAPGPARLLVVLPYGAVGLGVALHALPWPALAVALALPAARRAARAAPRPRGAAVLAGHARLFALLLVASLLAVAVTGADLPL